MKKIINFVVQFCGLLIYQGEKPGVRQETEVEKFGCLQPLKKMLKLRTGGACRLCDMVIPG